MIYRKLIWNFFAGFIILPIGSYGQKELLSTKSQIQALSGQNVNLKNETLTQFLSRLKVPIKYAAFAFTKGSKDPSFIQLYFDEPHYVNTQWKEGKSPMTLVLLFFNDLETDKAFGGLPASRGRVEGKQMAELFQKLGQLRPTVIVGGSK